jgi:hypothetical protein
MMRRCAWMILFVIWSADSVSAQRSQSTSVQARRNEAASADATAAACKTVDTMAPLVDGAFDGREKETRMLTTLLTDPEDSVWDELTDCANGTRRPSEASEALRVSAVWERLRSEAFQKLYRDSAPVSAPACADLERTYSIVKAANDQSDTSSKPDNRGVAIRKKLIDCANESYRLNQSRPRPQEADAAEYLSVWTERNQKYLIASYNDLVHDYNQLLESANELVVKYNVLLDDYEKERSLAMQAINANDSSLKSLERMVLFQSMQVRPMNCGGTSYSYGKWGTFNLECH